MPIRIIAGARRGLILKTVEFEGFRPTLARVRESLFGILTPIIEGARVLDLFAGSGSLGLEAISRGAASVLFVDDNRYATKTIEDNVAKARWQDRCRVFLGDYADAGKRIARGEQFDLVFVDPPYMQGYPQRVIDHFRQANLLNAEGVICLEMDKRETRELDISGFRLIRDKKYGATMIWILRRDE
jgi:16S rRNA (guanine966-N2)-methyltransferase